MNADLVLSGPTQEDIDALHGIGAGEDISDQIAAVLRAKGWLAPNTRTALLTHEGRTLLDRVSLFELLKSELR